MPDDLADLVTSVPQLLKAHPAIATGLGMAKLGEKIERGYHRVRKALKGRPPARTTDIRLRSDRELRGGR